MMKQQDIESNDEYDIQLQRTSEGVRIITTIDGEKDIVYLDSEEWGRVLEADLDMREEMGMEGARLDQKYNVLSATQLVKMHNPDHSCHNPYSRAIALARYRGEEYTEDELRELAKQSGIDPKEAGL